MILTLTLTPLPHHHPHHKVNRPPNLSVKKKETRNYVFQGRRRIGVLVGGIDFKQLRARKRPFLYERHKMLGDLKRVHKRIIYGHSVQSTSFFFSVFGLFFACVLVPKVETGRRMIALQFQNQVAGNINPSLKVDT